MTTEDSPAQSTPEGDAGPCDPRALTRIRKWGGEKLLQEMVQLFLAHAPEGILAVRQGIREGNASGAEAAAHSLKSSCAQLGAVRMQALCGEIEALAARGELASLPELVELLEGEFREYLACISKETTTAAE